MTSSLIKIAQIHSAHGIRGEVKLACFLENPYDIERYNPLISTSGKWYDISVTGRVKDTLIARVKDVGDRNAAELLKGIELFTSSKNLPEKSENEYYHQELIGLAAVNDADEKIGEVLAIHNFGAGDIIEISSQEGSVMLPFKAPFVGEIRLEKGTLHVTMPDYLGEED